MSERREGVIPLIDHVGDGTGVLDFEIDDENEGMVNAVLGGKIANFVLGGFEEAEVDRVDIKPKKVMLDNRNSDEYVVNLVDASVSHESNRCELRVEHVHVFRRPDSLDIEMEVDDGDRYVGVVYTTPWDDSKQAKLQSGQTLSIEELWGLLGEGRVATVGVRSGGAWVLHPLSS